MLLRWFADVSMCVGRLIGKPGMLEELKRSSSSYSPVYGMLEYVMDDYAEGLIYKEGIERKGRVQEVPSIEGGMRRDEGVVDGLEVGQEKVARHNPLRLSYATRAFARV